MMDSIVQSFHKLEQEVYQLEGVQKSLSFTIDELNEKMNSNKSRKELAQKCIEVLDITQKVIQGKMKDGFETVSTNALQSVFGEGYHLKLEFDRRGSIPEVKMFIKTPEMSKDHDPDKANAGGQKDLIALILRMVVMGFIQPEGGTPLKLDEPFSQLGEGDIENTGKCLKSIVDKFDRQVIMVTHHKDKFLKFGDNCIEFK